MKSFLLCVTAVIAGYLIYENRELSKELHETQIEIQFLTDALNAEKARADTAYDSGFDAGIVYQDNRCRAEKSELKKDFYKRGYEDGFHDMEEECNKIRRAEINQRDSIIHIQARQMQSMKNQIQTLSQELRAKNQLVKKLANSLLYYQTTSLNQQAGEQKKVSATSTATTKSTISKSLKTGVLFCLLLIIAAFILILGKSRGVL